MDVSEVEVVVAEDSDVEAEEEDSEVDEEDSEEEVGVATPIGPVSVVIVAADEVASAKLSSQRKKKKKRIACEISHLKKEENSTHAELAAAGSEALLRSTVSTIWITPLSIRTSGRTILALKPFDSTKVPEELETNCRGSPAAEVALVDAVEFRGEGDEEFDEEELFWPNSWISGE